LDGFFEQLTDKQKENIESVCMDMWQAYISSVENNINNSNEKIAFDRFHVAKHLNEAVNKVRKEEHRLLMADGRDDLKKSKFKWLKNSKNMSNEEWREFSFLRNRNLKTARAWAIKETAGELWNYTYKASAEKAWNAWYGWAIRSRLGPVKKSARMVKKYLWGILNAIILKVNNGFVEGLNGRIQKIKNMACGFRNRERFRNAIYFHLGDLSLYPEMLSFWD
jgi:transposase